MNLIYNQTKIPKKQWRYGLRASSATGCGWVAVYNALCLLGREMAPEEVIRRLEHQVPLFHGNAGTLFFGPALMLRKLGFPVTVTADRKQFDAVAKNAKVCVLYYYWRRGWKIGAHFVTVYYENGRFRGLNTYTNSDGPDDYGTSLQSFLKERGYFGCVLAGIRQKNDP